MRTFTEHAHAIVKTATQKAEAHWGLGWRRITAEQKQAYVCMSTIDILNLASVRAAASPQTLIDVLELVARGKGATG